MRVALDILKRDLLALAKNPIALLVVGALLVLPGLYAWYCIIANWDPYSNTGSMPIAVVNEDAGAKNDLAGEVNIGRQVTDKLKDNDNIDWRFYDSEEEALEDTRKAKVYATLVMPADLSANIVGLLDGSGDTPVIRYYPNEKYNAVATKVSDSAAQTLIRQINQGFSSTVNAKVLSAAQEMNEKADRRAEQTRQSAIAEVKQVQADLDQVIASLDDAASAMAGWRDAAAGAKASLRGVADQMPQLMTGLTRGSDELNDFRAKTDDFESGLAAAILGSASSVSEMSAQTATALNNASADLKTVESDLEAVANAASGSGDAELKEAAESLAALISLIDGIVEGVDGRVSEMNGRVQDMTGNVKEGTSRISNEVMPQMNTGTYQLARALSGLSGALGQFEPQITSLQDVLDQTDSALEIATASITDAKALLTTISVNLKGTASDIGAIGNALQVERIAELLDIDPENVGSFVSMPVEMVTEKVYPVSNYGTAVAPFYTNLALWIGCFILVSLMKVEVTGFPEATAGQRYFGRWMLFVLLSLLQSQVICGVDILLGIDCGNPALFMLAGAVCSFAYMNLIYALVKTFRNIGKTLCIFLLIMQVPGSSGMYPIQMMPGFFQSIHPALPFTYGIDAMREALSGLNGLTYLADVLVLATIVPVSLLVGLGLRPAMTNLLLLFDEEMNKTGFFASEELQEGDRREGVRGMLRALQAHEAYADDIEERAWRFNRLYPRLRRAGTVATFAIPFAFLIVIFPFNLALGDQLSTDAKLTALIVVLVALAAVLFGLIVLEYMHRSITEETRLLGASIIGDWDAFAGAGAGDEARDDFPHGKHAAEGMVPATAGWGAGPVRGGPARDIFATDMRLGFQSVIGVVVTMLLVVTPSLYAWFNIAGSWDPYSSTGNLEVAVANSDQGYKGELVPVTINIGDSVVSQLRGNTSFDWVFVDEDEAVAGVKASEYYAAIVIPADFSERMLTYLTDDASYPNVVYYTNEKENPIAPIITQKGADSIQENIRVSFTKRVDEVVLSVAYDVLNYVKRPNLSSYTTKMSAHLDDATRDTKSASREIRSLAALARTTSGVVGTLDSALAGLRSAGDSAKQAIAEAKEGAANASAAFDGAVDAVEGMIGERVVDVDAVEAIVEAALDLLSWGADLVPEGVQEQVEIFEALANDEHLSEPAREKVRVLVEDLKAAKQHADAAAANADAAPGTASALAANAKAEVENARSYFSDTVKPQVEQLHGTLADISASTSAVVDGLEAALGGIGDSTSGLSNQLTALSSGLEKAAGKLETSADKVDDLKKRVSEALKSGDVKQIEDVILGGDPETLAASLAAPVNQKREALYPVSNYGSSMAPFYTVLSLWVGALVMISTMRVHVVEQRMEELRRRYAKVRPRHEFFGRYGIFGFIGLLQSSLVLLGDVLFLHIQCAQPVLFFLAGLFIGQVFCLLVYTITELFGDVGKALCVILLIMQVAASGGTFPVQMLDPLLSGLVPFLPFYHAMTMLQECVAGVYWPQFLNCVGALLVPVAVALVAGVPLRKPFRKVNDFFEEQLEKTGYM